MKIVQGDFTKKGNNTKTKIKVAILGSHATTNILCNCDDLIINEVYEICYMREAISFLNLVEEDLEALVIAKPDYIIFDLFTDVYLRVISESVNMEVACDSEDARIRISNGSDISRKSMGYQTTDFIMSFRRSFDKFYKEVRLKLPNVKIIMHRLKLISELVEHPNYDNLPNQILSDMNISFFMLEEVMSRYMIKVIDVTTNRSIVKERAGQNKGSYITYKDKYTDAFINQFNNICLIDLL